MRKFMSIVFALFIALALSSCASLSQKSSENIITDYRVWMDGTLPIFRAYHFINKRVAIRGEGKKPDELLEVTYYYFSLANPNYKNKSQEELIEIIEGKTNIEPTVKKKSKKSKKDSMVKINDEEFLRKKGSRSVSYYYF